MKRKKIWRRALAAVATSIMLLSSMTVFAAPPKSDTPTWRDVWNIQDFLYDNVDKHFMADELWLVDDVENDITHAPSGKLLLDVAIWNNFLDLDEPFAQDPGEVDENDPIDGERADNYSAWYDAAIAVVDGMTEATGEYYVDDAIWEEFEILNGKIDSIWEWNEAEKIIIVNTAQGVRPPDETKMESGTYWVAEADWDIFCTMNERRDELFFNYFGPEGEKDVTAAQVEEICSVEREMADFIYPRLHGKAEPESVVTTTRKSSSKRQESSVPEEEEPVIVNQVVASDGTKSVSTIEGVYGRTCVAGAIYKDQAGKIKQAAGLTEEEIGSGVLVKSYICESLNKDVNKNLTAAAADKGYKLLGIINNDLYKMNKGNIMPVRKTGESLTVVLGVPEKLRNDSYEFAVLCHDENGSVVELQDLDTDKATITVQASDFGYWAIVYREKAK